MAYLAEAQSYNRVLADFHRQSLSGDDLSSNELMVDSDEILLDAENEKDDVAIITPDSDTDVENTRLILANDRTFLHNPLPVTELTCNAVRCYNTRSYPHAYRRFTRDIE